MKERDHLHQLYIKEKNKELKAHYHSMYKNKRNLILTLQRTSKKQYFSDFFLENQANIKKTWEGIRNLLNVSKKSSSTLSKIIDKDQVLNKNSDISKKMNNFYVNVGNEIDKKIPVSKRKYTDFLGDKITNKIVLNDCSNIEVANLIHKMSTSKASGPFSIPSKILKEFDVFFVPLLTKIINKSFKEGVFPSNLKCAKVIPIYKKGDKTQCPNYRPISLLSNVSKIFERIMYNRLETHLNSNSILYEHP